MSGLKTRRHVMLGLAAVALAAAAPSFAQDAPIPARPFVEVPVAHPIPRTAKPMRDSSRGRFPIPASNCRSSGLAPRSRFPLRTERNGRCW